MEMIKLFKKLIYLGLMLPFFCLSAANMSSTKNLYQPKYDNRTIKSNPTTNPGYKTGVSPQSYHAPPQRKLPPAPKQHPQPSSSEQKYHPGGGGGGGTGY